MTNFNFIGNSRKLITISIILIAIVLIGTFVIGVDLGIEFKGGSMITYAYDGEINVTEFEEKADNLLGSNVSAVSSTDAATGIQAIVVTLPGTQSLSSDQMAEFTKALQSAYPQNNLHSVQINNVDATIGREFLLKSIWAMIFASLVMIIYVGVRFRRIGGLSAGVMAVVALLHDVFIAFGAFVLFSIPIDDNFIAVVLTILGFSLNDTIIIYDRIRENKRILGSKVPIGELVNTSINQSFARSLNTSLAGVGAMVIVTIVAYVYNVASIQSFAFPLIVGLAAGSYSTICIAGPLWVKWQEHKLDKMNAA